MNIWLVTTGSSDVQLGSGSDEAWKDWYTDLKKSLNKLPFKPIKADDDELYRLPARVLGIAFEQLEDEVRPKLEFPLLQEFTKELKAKDIFIDEIVVLMSDQENLFDEDDRETKQCAYWQDTCQLYPILEEYFNQHFPSAEIKPLFLRPSSMDKGLDDWDAVLGLVQHEVEGLKFPSEPQTIFVSHQAGTPAISSAIQFSSLARFGDRVRFLVSSEQSDRSPDLISSSAYLKGIRKQEAKKLLERYDYSGIYELISTYLDDVQHQETKILLEAAIQWNFAKFDDFANKIGELSDQVLVQAVSKRAQYWWWIGFEAAYLAFVRLEQKNAVEAFFHSFRAVEGLISRWTEVAYPDHVDSNNDSPQVKISILKVLPDYLGSKKQEHLLTEFKARQKLGLHSFPLYDLLRKGKPDWRKSCKALPIFTDQIAPKRNKLFHRLRGLENLDVLQEWKVNSSEELEARLRSYLNFISDQSFASLSEASLMTEVNRRLKDAIAHL